MGLFCYQENYRERLFQEVGVGTARRDQAFELFDQGNRPSSPEVKALGLKSKTLYNYFQEWKKAQGLVGEVPAHNGNGNQPSQKAGKAPLTTQFEGAAYLQIQPRTFTMTSTIIWQAQEAAINVWGWPEDMTVEQFLNTFIYIAFKQRGILLGGYQVIKSTEDGDGEDRRGSSGAAYTHAS